MTDTQNDDEGHCSLCGLHKKPFDSSRLGPPLQRDSSRPKVLFVYVIFILELAVASGLFHDLSLCELLFSLPDDQLQEYKGISKEQLKIPLKLVNEQWNIPKEMKDVEDIPFKFERHKQVYRLLVEKYSDYGGIQFLSTESLGDSKFIEAELRKVHSQDFVDTLFISDFKTFLPYREALQVQLLKDFFDKDWESWNPNLTGNQSLRKNYLSDQLAKPLLKKLRSKFSKNKIKWGEFVEIERYDERQLKWLEFLEGFGNYPDFDSELKYTESGDSKWERVEDYYANDLREIVKRYCLLTFYCAKRMAKPLEQGGVALAFNYAGGLHHARIQKGFGFCPANDIALAIKYWRDREPTAKILYVDIDFHHGDGVEQIFYRDAQVFTFSTHGSFSFPLTGCYADRFGNPTALSRPFWYDHSKGHFGAKKKREQLNPEDKKELEIRRAKWLEEVKAELSQLFQEHAFAYVVLQTGVDSVIGGDGNGKLNLIIRPFLTADNHKDLALHVTKLSAEGGSKLLVLGGGGYDVDNAVKQWTDEFKAIEKTFTEKKRERGRLPVKKTSSTVSEGKWDKNASNELIRIKFEIENQEWFPLRPDPENKDYTKLTDEGKEENNKLLDKIHTKFPKIQVWDDMPYFSDSIQKNFNAFLTKIPILQTADEVDQYVDTHFKTCIPDKGKSIHVAFKSEIVKHATKQFHDWAKMAFSNAKSG